VRELENVLERAVSNNADDAISVLDLPEMARSGRLLEAASP
jgi:DNA-binding NtrC family response regulator